jgi:small subunit ribosomal protein S21
LTIPQRQKEYGRGKKREKQFDGSKVIVQDGRFEQAMRQFKRKIEDNGLLQELRDRQEYVKPTTKRKMAAGRAKARWRKLIRSQQLPEKFY